MLLMAGAATVLTMCIVSCRMKTANSKDAMVTAMALLRSLPFHEQFCVGVGAALRSVESNPPAAAMTNEVAMARPPPFSNVLRRSPTILYESARAP